MANGRYNTARIFYVWECSACRKSEEVFYHVGRGDQLPKPPIVPDAWTVIDDRTLCPAHKIVMFIDDKLLGSEGQQ